MSPASHRLIEQLVLYINENPKSIPFSLYPLEKIPKWETRDLTKTMENDGKQLLVVVVVVLPLPPLLVLIVLVLLLVVVVVLLLLLLLLLVVVKSKTFLIDNCAI